MEVANFKKLMIIAGTAVLVGCGGAGGALSPTPADKPLPTQRVAASLTIVIPRPSVEARHKLYISPATRSLVASIGGISTTVSLTTPSPCVDTTAGQSCNVSISVPPGLHQQMTIIAYGSTDGTGAALSRNTVYVDITPGQANNIDISLGGVVSSWSLSISPQWIYANTAARVQATYTAYDASGNPIITSPAEPLFDPNGNIVTPKLEVSDASASIGPLSGNTWSVSEPSPTGQSHTFTVSSGSSLPTATATLAIKAGDDWNTFGHDMRRTGYDTLPNPINKTTAPHLQLLWSYTFPKYTNYLGQLKPAGFYASPIVVNGVVYVLPRSNLLTAFDAKTGLMLWQKALVPQYPTYEGFQTPALYDGTIFAGSYTSNGILTAVDALTHNTLWQTGFQPGGFRSSPVMVNGKLYIGENFGDPPACQPGGIYSYDEHTGQLDSSWLTSPTSGQDGGGVWGPLTWTGSAVVFGTGNTCLANPATGDAIAATTASMDNLWHVSTVPDSTKDDDDVASGVLDVNNVGYVSAKNGSLYAVDLSSGNVLWSENLGAPNKYGGFATPGYVGGTLFASRGYTYTSATGGMLYGLDLNGNVKWTIPSQNILLGQVVGVNDVAFAEIDNSINAIDPGTGQILWSYATQGQFESSPAIVPSGLFVTDLSGTVYAFGLPGTDTTASETRTQSSAVKGSTRYAVPAPPKFCLLP